jgi:hypothetical protein
LGGGSNSTGADELRSLLGPDAVAAGVDPRRPGVQVVIISAHDGGVAVTGQRDGVALPPAASGVLNRAGADQFASLLAPDTVAEGVDPRRPVPPEMWLEL